MDHTWHETRSLDQMVGSFHGYGVRLQWQRESGGLPPPQHEAFVAAMLEMLVRQLAVMTEDTRSEEARERFVQCGAWLEHALCDLLPTSADDTPRPPC
jgi:hypothetical protein